MGVIKTIGSLFSTGASVFKTVTSVGSIALSGIKTIASSKVVKALGGAFLGVSAFNVIKNATDKNSVSAATPDTTKSTDGLSSGSSGSSNSATTDGPVISSATNESKGFFGALGESVHNAIGGAASLLKGLVGKTVTAAENIKEGLNISEKDDAKTETSKDDKQSESKNDKQSESKNDKQNESENDKQNDGPEVG